MLKQHLPRPISRVVHRLDNIVTRVATGVLVAKFIGDYFAILLTGTLGKHTGYQAGVVIAVTLAVVWEDIRRVDIDEATEKATEAAEKASEAADKATEAASEAVDGATNGADNDE